MELQAEDIGETEKQLVLVGRAISFHVIIKIVTQTMLWLSSAPKVARREIKKLQKKTSTKKILSVISV
ncbi:MAG: hypothetical protein AB2693_35200 [Candidatus Thiodiazotropha sp.]